MESFLTANEMRRLLIIDTLSEQTDFMSLKDLSIALDSSINTCLTDIEAIQEMFQEIKIIQSNQGYKLSLNNKDNFQSINAHFITQNFNYSILLYIFHHDACSIEEVADSTFSSIATVSRAIQHINKVFDYFKIDIHLETNPLRLIGPENEIRYFFGTIYHIIGDHDNPEFKEFNRAFSNFFRMILKETFYQNVSFDDLKEFISKCYINFVRMKQGFLMEVNNYQPILIELILSPDSQPIRNFYTKHCPEYDDLTAFVETIYPLSVSPSIFIYEESFNQMIISDTEYIDRSLQFLRRELRQICQNFHIQMDKEDKIITTLHNEAQYIVYSKRAYYFMLDSLKNYRQIFLNEFPLFYDTCYKLLERYSELILGEVNDEFVSLCVDTLLIQWPDIIYQLFGLHQSIKVLIANSVSYKQGLFIKDILEYDHCAQLKIDVWEDELDQLNDEIINQYDILISDYFTDEIIDAYFIHITTLTYTVELGHTIRDAINKIRKERIRDTNSFIIQYT